MNDCNYTSRIGPYHDQELAPDEMAEVSRHLESCPACRVELAGLRALSEAIGAAVPRLAPPQVMDRLHRAVDQLPGARTRRLAEALGGLAAAVLVACSVALTVLPSRSGGGAIPLWEMTAVSSSSGEQAADSDEQLAQWTAQDLSGTNSNE
jgi:anti-sigma factor RsiW